MRVLAKPTSQRNRIVPTNKKEACERFYEVFIAGELVGTYTFSAAYALIRSRVEEMGISVYQNDVSTNNHGREVKVLALDMNETSRRDPMNCPAAHAIQRVCGAESVFATDKWLVLFYPDRMEAYSTPAELAASISLWDDSGRWEVESFTLMVA